MEIKYVTHDNIDKRKWDEAINNSFNGLIYCQSFFLDACCQWDALVSGNYDYVMPLPNKKKIGIRYIYTPQFIGQLGIVSKNIISEEICTAFIEAIPPHFFYVDLQLNQYNPSPYKTKNAQLIQRKNFTLLLDKEYSTLSNNYSKDGKKNLRQSVPYNLQFTNDVTLQNVFDLYLKAYDAIRKNTSVQNYTSFFNVCTKAITLHKGFIAGVKNAKGEIISAAFFGKDDKRLYYLLGAPSPEGRESRAQHFLIDKIIEEFAGSSLILDFEGSDIESVATFYKKFNPAESIYSHLIINRLPWFLRWLKH